MFGFVNIVVTAQVNVYYASDQNFLAGWKPFFERNCVCCHDVTDGDYDNKLYDGDLLDGTRDCDGEIDTVVGGDGAVFCEVIGWMYLLERVIPHQPKVKLLKPR